MSKRTAIITGANRGIGYSLVESFAKAGYDIWACARSRTEDFVNEMDRIASENNCNINNVFFDLSNEEEIKESIKSILQTKIPIDVLVNNAGVPFGGSFNMTSTDIMRDVFQVNVFAQVLIMQLVSKSMIKNKRGCIINMCSVGGIEAEPGYLAYGSSKAALIWITREAAKEYGNFGIRVNGIAPGLIETNMGNYKSVEEKEKIINRMVIHRMGKASEIAKAALYLASDDAAFITGQIMVIDGGRCI